MKKLGVLAMVLAFCMSGLVIVTQAETLQGPDSHQVLLFKSQDRMDFAIKHLASGGSYMDPVYLSTIAGLVDSGTRCSVIKSTLLRKQVRVLEGPFKGVVGWTATEMVSP